MERRDALALVPLRLFLGVTFVFAGLQKLADRNFLSHSSPSSIHAQLQASAHGSPIAAIVHTLTPHATLLGVVIAVAELLVGAAALVGLLLPVAAVIGVLLSLGFLLTVSWHTRPYYYGSDIVFLFAWMALALARYPGLWTLDAALARGVRRSTAATTDLDRRVVL